MIKNECTPDQLVSALMYEAKTGKLFWRYRVDMAKSWNARFSGKEAFTAESCGYRVGRLFGQKYRAHRVIWAMKTGAWPSDQIDHIDGNRSNNCICNLREATNSENNINKKNKIKSSSSYRGVSWHKRDKKWVAQIAFLQKRIHIGSFSCEADAARAYDAAAKKYHKQFASLNF